MGKGGPGATHMRRLSAGCGQLHMNSGSGRGLGWGVMRLRGQPPSPVVHPVHPLPPTHPPNPPTLAVVDEQSKVEIKEALLTYDRTLLVADPRRMEPKKWVPAVGELGVWGEGGARLGGSWRQGVNVRAGGGWAVGRQQGTGHVGSPGRLRQRCGSSRGRVGSRGGRSWGGGGAASQGSGWRSRTQQELPGKWRQEQVGDGLGGRVNANA
jgi:hypothetical protein